MVCCLIWLKKNFSQGGRMICDICTEKLFRGLMFKTMCRIHAKSVSAVSSWKCCAPKNSLIEKNVCAYTCKHFSLYKSQSTWRLAGGITSHPALCTPICDHEVSAKYVMNVWISCLQSVPTLLRSGWMSHVLTQATVPRNLPKPCLWHK